MDKHLTEPNPHLAALVRRTPPGMMHWAGTGPEGMTCEKCRFYGYFYETRKGLSKQKTSACGLYYRRMQKHGDAFDATTPACKYFEQRDR